MEHSHHNHKHKWADEERRVACCMVQVLKHLSPENYLRFSPKVVLMKIKKKVDCCHACLYILLFLCCGNEGTTMTKWGFSNVWPLKFQMEAGVIILVHNAAVEITSVGWNRNLSFHIYLVGKRNGGSSAAGCWCQGVNESNEGNKWNWHQQALKLMLGCTSRISCSCFF